MTGYEFNKPNDNLVLIGIELGVYETSVARFNEAGKAEIVLNNEGESFTPSVVMLDGSGSTIVGREASKFIGTGTPGVYAEFIREMGDSGGNPSPTLLTSALIRYLKRGVEGSFGELKGACIALPACANQHFRTAVRAACQQAGVSNVKLVNEPTAAALYLSSQEDLRGRYLWYRLGQGSFEASIFESKEDSISIVTSMGVQRLGTKDFDKKLLDLIHQKYARITGDQKDSHEWQVDCNFSNWELLSLRETLNSRPKSSLRLVSAQHGPLVIEISQEEFAAACHALLTQAELAVDTALDNAKLSTTDLDGVFYTCEDGLRPIVEQSVGRHTAHQPRPTPSQIVALGAALLAAKKFLSAKHNALQHMTKLSLKVVDVSPHYLGLIIRDWLTGTLQNRTIIIKDTPIPCSQSFEVNADGAGYFPPIRLTQSGSEQSDPDFVDIIGTIAPPRLQPDAAIRLTIGYDENGVAYLSLENTDDGGAQELRVGPSAPLRTL